MTNIKPLMKRICAYMIDMIVVLILATLVSNIPVFTKGMEDYQKTYTKYEEEYTEYSEYLELLKESYTDEELSEEEYTKLTEVITYKEIIASKYDDNNISKGEYKEIVNSINEQFDKVVADYNYILGKEGISNSIITLSCTLLYFGVIQYFLKGQTIGKKLLKLKVVSASDKPINVLNYLLRTLIVNEVLLNAVGLVFLFYTSKSVYLQANNYLGIILSIIEGIIIFLVLTREDQRGLHDMLFNTKVISVEKSVSKTQVIDAQYKEESE